jgi:hypothetical protein
MHLRIEPVFSMLTGHLTRKKTVAVMPAQAGIQRLALTARALDARLHAHDVRRFAGRHTGRP